ncbi:MAG: cytochrome C [Thiobacillus sp. GWE1_62_9]|nr:MAG: cytochrome C [Thiobacillus sp. GWE1_62_9]HBU29683.1 cytochrome C [Thiobacillus sp.]
MKPILNCAGVLALSLAAAAAWAGEADIRHGRYLIQTSGCNDCHTAGYMQKDGHVPEAEWLTGDTLGWQGPWGTTYPANLRLLFSQIDEKTWLARARLPMRPPMPSPSLRAMSDDDLRAIYRYVKSLGAKGQPAPAYVPPGGKVATPYFDLTPKNLPVVAGK